jgi:hypothetical protein
MDNIGIIADRDKAEAEHENIERQKTTNGIF